MTLFRNRFGFDSPRGWGEGGWMAVFHCRRHFLEREITALARRISSYRSPPYEYSHIIRLLQLPRISAFSPHYSRLLGKSMLSRSGGTPTRVCASARSFSLSHVSRASIAAIIAADATYVHYSMTPRSPRCVRARTRVGGTNVHAYVCVCPLCVSLCTCIRRARGEVPVNGTVAFIQPSYLCWLEKERQASKEERECGR